jgi:hypothetical protein
VNAADAFDIGNFDDDETKGNCTIYKLHIYNSNRLSPEKRPLLFHRFFFKISKPNLKMTRKKISTR